MPDSPTPNIKLVVRRLSLVVSRRPTTVDQRRNSGGADRDRTGGLLVANQALSQLSYSPVPQLPVLSCQLPELGTGHWVLATDPGGPG
jgi:hypothetical protein